MLKVWDLPFVFCLVGNHLIVSCCWKVAKKLSVFYKKVKKQNYLNPMQIPKVTKSIVRFHQTTEPMVYQYDKRSIMGSAALFGIDSSIFKSPCWSNNQIYKFSIWLHKPAHILVNRNFRIRKIEKFKQSMRSKSTDDPPFLKLQIPFELPNKRGKESTREARNSIATTVQFLFERSNIPTKTCIWNM